MERCPKCRGDQHPKIEYKAGDYYGWPCRVYKKEHLKYICKTCSYSWEEKCQDDDGKMDVPIREGG